MQLDRITHKTKPALPIERLLERPVVYVLQAGEHAIQCPTDPCDMSLPSVCHSLTRGRVVLKLRPYRRPGEDSIPGYACLTSFLFPHGERPGVGHGQVGG